MSRSPIVPRRRLGAELRRLRELSSKSVEEAAAALECSPSKVSRLETGKGVPRTRDVRDLVELYGVADDAQRLRLLRWTAEGQGQGWWNSYRDVTQGDLVPDHLLRLISLEADASEIRSFQPEVIPGLLQTEEYIYAIAPALDSEISEAERQRFVNFRLERQEILRRGELGLQVVLGEIALVRPFVDPNVLARQFGSLREQLDNGLSFVDLRILPLRSSVRDAIGGSFVVIKFDDEQDPDVVYLEGREGATYLEREDDVKKYDAAFEAIERASLSRSESLTLLEQRAGDRVGP